MAKFSSHFHNQSREGGEAHFSRSRAHFIARLSRKNANVANEMKNESISFDEIIIVLFKQTKKKIQFFSFLPYSKHIISC
jgi:hypothetical protein